MQDKVLTAYRGLLDRMSRDIESRKEGLRMHAEADCIPVDLGSDAIQARANQHLLEYLKQSFTADFRGPMLEVVADVAHDILRKKIDRNWCRDATADYTLTPDEAKAFERAMMVAAMVYSPPRLVVFDSYGNVPDDGSRRQRDLAIIWDGFATMKWTERIRNIRSVLNELRLRSVGVTQHEIEFNAVPGLTSRIHGRRVATAIPLEIQRCASCGASLLKSGQIP